MALKKQLEDMLGSSSDDESDTAASEYAEAAQVAAAWCCDVRGLTVVAGGRRTAADNSAERTALC